MSHTKTTIADIICLKTWVSSGAISNKGTDIEQEIKRPFYPKFGMTFKGTSYGQTIDSKPVKKYLKLPDGTYSCEEMHTRPRDEKTVTFEVNDLHVPTNDPATGKPVKRFPPKFLADFQKAIFYENGDNILVSSPISIADIETPPETPKIHRPLSVTFTVELYRSDEDHKVYMLQRAYWSDGYLGTYCCG